ncbi:hypothetical protein D3C77_629190 [compost metagenome]
MVIRFARITGKHAHLPSTCLAATPIRSEIWRIEIHITLDNAHSHLLHLDWRLHSGNAFTVVVNRIHEPIGGPFISPRRWTGVVGGRLLTTLRGRLFDDDSINADFAAHAQ